MHKVCSRPAWCLKHSKHPEHEGARHMGQLELLSLQEVTKPCCESGSRCRGRSYVVMRARGSVQPPAL